MNGPPTLRHHLCFLDVGHGNATVIVDGAQNVAVIDVGKQSALSRFLAEQQITRIKFVYISHADEDHIGALIGLLGSPQVTIDHVFLNSDAQKTSKVWDDLVYELNAAHGVGKLVFTPSLTAGRTEQLSDRVSLEVLGPSPYLAAKGPGSVDRHGRRIRSNSISAVIAISIEGRRLALLPADLDTVGLQNLMDNKASLDASILVYPHHGGLPGSMGPSGFANTLLPMVRPDKVIFSIGRGRHGTPNPLTVSSIRAAFPDVRIVCTQLSKHCSAVPPAKRAATHLTPAFAQGRLDGTCCGGTIVVPLDQSNALQPDHGAHTNFIRTHVQTPLCLGNAPQSNAAGPAPSVTASTSGTPNP